MMESAFLTFILVLSFAEPSTQFGLPDWDDVVVVRESQPTTLICTETVVKGPVAFNWKMKPVGAKDWKLVLLANEWKEVSGGASKESMRLTDPNYQESGVFSLSFLPKMEDRGYYSCLIKQNKWKLKERVILLAILTVNLAPAAPIPQQSTLQLKATVNPDFAITEIIWTSPSGTSMKSERIKKSTVARLPMVQKSDRGAYVCIVRPLGNGSSPIFSFNVSVTVADKVISSSNVKYEPLISTATVAGTPVPLTCPVVQGDYVRLWWRHPDKKDSVTMVYQYDRWRGYEILGDKWNKINLAGPPYNEEAGSFSFLLTPELEDSGVYSCEVFHNDQATSQRTQLSVLRVTATHSATELELECQYKERNHVGSAKWKYQDESRQLDLKSKSLGIIFVSLPLPITSDTAGNYTCALQLKNGQTVSAVYVVKPPYKGGHDESGSVTTPSLLPSLSALLLLVPLVAAAVGVLLWRQKHISGRGIEQSLSFYSGEVENIYENPEDIRQAPPQGSVYMDLKPREEDDVYKELERS